MLKYHMGDNGNRSKHTYRRQPSIIGKLWVLASEQFLKIKEWKYPDRMQIRKNIVVLSKNTSKSIRYYLPAIPQLYRGIRFYQFTFHFLLILIILQYLLQKATAVQSSGLRLICNDFKIRYAIGDGL